MKQNIILSQGRVLRPKSGGRPVEHGDILVSHDGEQYTIHGGQAPRHSGSTGRVFVKQVGSDPHDMDREFFPSVFDLQWEEL